MNIYDQAYYKRYKKRAKSKKGQEIYRSRWELVEKYCHGDMTLLDYGCGPGAFHESSANGFKTSGYDVNPHCGFSVPPLHDIDIMTMWDVIEHLDDPSEPINTFRPKYLFISTPNVEAVGHWEVEDWKHYRPDEHLWYFGLNSLTGLLARLGYEILEFNYEEGGIRDPENANHIITVVAKRR